MAVLQYLASLEAQLRTGNAREHSYRGALEQLLKSIVPDVLPTNEPARVQCGAPDFVLTRKEIPVGYIEAKDINVDLKSKSLKEQFDRYKAGLSNLIFTDYLDFHFYKEGEFTTSVRIAEVQETASGLRIVPNTAEHGRFVQLIRNFTETVTQTIKSPTKLAQMMAGKAKLMADVIEKSLDRDDQTDARSQLKNQMLSFKAMLIHDIDNKAFADIYAQTIAYGMFAARYHDPTLPTFSREEAARLIPKSNPFLRKLFHDIAGYDLDDRLVWIVEELVSIFLASDVATIMRNFGRSTKQEDPVVHFYETFLAEYNPALRKARGVWYTPQPVVNFIVRAVDDILKTEFNLPDGLADTSKVKIRKKAVTQTGTGQKSKIKEVEETVEVHKVQILDPATGTGTFLAETVRHIHKKFEGQEGLWSKYVSKDLIPRLNGFELLMASYAMAHLKMDMLLTETGYKPKTDEEKNQRFRIYLTNSLEEAHPDTSTLFSSWLSDEADQANAIKRDTPVMVVMGNPPYSVSSTNKSEWIQNLIVDYKMGLNEKKVNLDDDYIKFIRFGQYFIDKNKSGILAYISNNSFVDGLTHRRMRESLLTTFDQIYVLDLHGSAKKKEKSPDGSVDQNVFDIMQGVSINIFVKTKISTSITNHIFHQDVYGNRKSKYTFLTENSLKSINWNTVNTDSPDYYFYQINQIGKDEYEQYFRINELFQVNNSGIKTDRDSLFVDFDQTVLNKRIEKLLSGTYDQKFSDDFNVKDSGSYKLLKSIAGKSFKSELSMPIQYRPFDNRWIYYDTDIISRPASKAMSHLVHPENLSISLKRQSKFDFSYSFVHRSICESCLFESAYANNSEFPLYLYPKESSQHTTDNLHRTPNLNPSILSQIASSMHAHFEPEPTTNGETVETNVFYPIDLLDYIYAVLHAPAYREKYKEFLKIDFPRVPYPTDYRLFTDLAAYGRQLRELHLLESPKVNTFITRFPEDGDGIVGKPVYKDGNVYINDTQYFANVPEVAWNFYIGGYQPAQKWLKDRKGRELNHTDIFHYQKMIVALTETDRLMRKIDGIITPLL